MSAKKAIAVSDDAPGPPETDAEEREYRAMRGRKANRSAYLLAVPNMGQDDRFLPFARLLLMDARKDGRQIVLEFSGCSVLLEGRNLRPIANAVASQWCASVEAFDPNKRDEPADPGAPFIERIRFYYPESDPPAAAVERDAARTH